ncbi:MAG: hypothetical protein E7574_00535 [Ruminococcaceae bacterium]|nr:hypothetical protein [Oscillospiraceae bacterium]
MDGKKTDGKKSVRYLLGEYFGEYIEGVPKTRDELIEKLPFYLKKLGLLSGNAVMGWLFGSMALAYSAIPLGTAYLAASSKYVGAFYIGLVVSALNEKTGLMLPLLLIYTALLVARVLVYRSYGMEDKSFDLFDEKLMYKMLGGFSASLLISVYRAATFGFLYYDIVGGVIEVISVPLLIKLYDYVFDKRYKFDIRREVGLIAVMVSVVVALADVYIWGFSMGVMAVAIITLYISKSAGSLRGGIYGLICGFFCNVAMSPVFAVIGMVAGVFWKIGIAASVSVSCIVGIICGIYIDGWQCLTNFVPEFLCSSILFMPFAQFKLLPRFCIYTDGIAPTDDSDVSLILAEKRQRDTEKRFEDLSSAFSDLSEVFYTLSDRVRRPGIIDTREICDEICNIYCPKCVMRSICWEKEYSSTQDVFAKISKALCDKGYVESDMVAGFMKDRCRHMDRMLERINDSHAGLLESMIKQNKTEVFAMDYESMAHLLESAVKINCEEYLPDEDTRNKLVEACRHMKFSARNICVYGKRKLSIIAGGVDLKAVKMTAKEIKQCFENICGVRLTTPTYEVDGDYITMTLESERRFGVEFAAASNTKANENFCGDLICMFENGHDYFYSLISDGMGSGREAALTSRLCGIFLKKMLMAGNSKPVALEMLNNFIRSKNTECFSTVDLLEIDLLNGRAGFVKSGAVASYVMRGDKIFRINSNTMPVGITREINAEEVKFELENGDVIVMVSDGVGQSAEDLVRVSNILTYSWEDDLQKMADKILKDAVDSSARSDDVSVGIIRVTEKET